MIKSYILFICSFSDKKEWGIERTISAHLTLMCDRKEKKGCVRKPVINVEPKYCPPDFLHMKKGIITKLLDQLVDWVVSQHKENQLIDQMKHHKIPFTYDWQQNLNLIKKYD